MAHDNLEPVVIDVGYQRPVPRAKSLVHGGPCRLLWAKATSRGHLRGTATAGRTGPTPTMLLPGGGRRVGFIHSNGIQRSVQSHRRRWRRGHKGPAGSIQVRQARGGDEVVIGAARAIFFPTPKLAPASRPMGGVERWGMWGKGGLAGAYCILLVLALRDVLDGDKRLIHGPSNCGKHRQDSGGFGPDGGLHGDGGARQGSPQRHTIPNSGVMDRPSCCVCATDRLSWQDGGGFGPGGGWQRQRRWCWGSPQRHPSPNSGVKDRQNFSITDRQSSCVMDWRCPTTLRVRRRDLHSLGRIHDERPTRL